MLAFFLSLIFRKMKGEAIKVFSLLFRQKQLYLKEKGQRL